MNAPPMISAASSNPASNQARIAHPPVYVWLISLVAAMGGLLFGYDWVVIGGAKPFYEVFFGLSNPSMQGWAMSCALVGCFVGALGSGPASNRLGRKKLLILSALLFAISSIGTALAATFAFFVAWRIIGGIAIGIASNLSPMYIAEVSPTAYRGRLVLLNQFTIVVGILLAQIINCFIAQPVPISATSHDILQSWNGQIGWRWMFGVTVLPSLLFLMGMLFAPESPRWLAGRGESRAAEGILQKIGGAPYASQTLAEITASFASETGTDRLTDLLRSPRRSLLGLGIFLAVFQQWCGINVIFNYAQEVFSAAGYKVSDILFNIVVTGAVNLLFTLVAFVLVDRLGRRSLMLFGAGALALIYLLLGLCYAFHSQGIHVLLLVMAAIACYALSLAPLTWVIISEIFPNRIRGAAMSLAVSFLWIACFILTFTFPLLNRSVGAAGTFWLYAGICLAGFAFLLYRLPETRGKSLDEVENTG